VSSIKTTTTAAPPPTVIPPPATATIISAAAHEADASRQGGQHRNGQPDLDLANQNINPIYAGQFFVEDIKSPQCHWASFGVISHGLSCPACQPGRICRCHETAKRQLTFSFDFHIPQNTPVNMPIAMGCFTHHNGLCS
jgi:hypothetical protein